MKIKRSTLDFKRMKFSRLLLISLFLGFIIYSCKNPLEDVIIKTKDALASSAIKISYYNANYSDPEKLPTDLKITITGPDADKIVNSVGGKKITYSKEGILGIAVSPDYSTRPLKFSVVAEATGYLTSIKEFVLTDQRNYNITQGLFKKSNLPSGLSVIQENL
jgi:hypothetical protein